ncbi:MAG: twin-arginine translocase subunit TatB [Actinomyces sp.]|nr:MAG: twin-arginine translocase subunit TatB [Actinomyces sp.]
MLNVGGGELVVILVVALIVLGPTRLPEAARQVGRAVTELRRLSSGFQRELQEALVDPVVEAEAREMGETLKRARPRPLIPPSPAAGRAATARDAASDGSGVAGTAPGVSPIPPDPDHTASSSPDPAGDTGSETDRRAG